MKYQVIQKYFDNGKVVALVSEAHDCAKDEVLHLPKFDKYVDIFDTKAEAEAFKNEALRA